MYESAKVKFHTFKTLKIDRESASLHSLQAETWKKKRWYPLDMRQTRIQGLRAHDSEAENSCLYE
jgi:hypothetical protein